MSSMDTYYNEEIKKENKRAQTQYNQISAQNTAMSNQYVQDVNAIVDKNIADSVNKVQGEIGKLPTAYQSTFDANAIQQKINERQTAEHMANLGLTDSGLNRTQQTALAIQRSNADAAARQQMNAASLSLKQQIADLYSQGEISKMQTAADARYQVAQTNTNLYNNLMSNADTRAYNTAQNRVNNDAAIAQAKIEAEAEANKITKEFDYGDYERSAAWYENAPTPAEGIRKLISYLNVLKGTKGYTDYQCQLVFRYITEERGNPNWTEDQIKEAMKANGIDITNF